MAIITPARFPNKSENSKLLLGTKSCNTSSKIDKNIKYKLKILNWLFFLKVKKPITERTMYAYKWFVEIIKSGVIWGCKLKSLYKNQPSALPGNKYKKIKIKLHK